MKTRCKKGTIKAVILMIALVLGVGIARPVYADSEYTGVSSFSELKSIVDEYSINASIRLDADITCTDVINFFSGDTITIDLNGHKLDFNNLDKYFCIDNSSSLTIEDSSVAKDGMIANSADSYGAIYNYGTLILNSGKICGNVRGVSINSTGRFIMNGGEISGNSGTDGGGVLVNGTFTMNGGRISNNTATDDGGGVCVNGTFIMNDGSVVNNTATGDTSKGAGISMSNNSTFIMTGGEISGNWLQSDSKDTNGAGLYTKYEAVVKISGDAIINNNYKGGTYSDGEFSNGVKSNVFLYDYYGNDKGYITVPGALTGNALVGISTNNINSLPCVIAADTYTDGLTSSDLSHFFSDDASLEVLLNSDNKIMLEEIIKNVSSWDELKSALANAREDSNHPTRIKLTDDITYTGDKDVASIKASLLEVPRLKYVSLDLNGKTIDRGLSGSDPIDDGYVIKVSDHAGLTINDSSRSEAYPYGQGKITGGNSANNCGGIYVYNSNLTLNGGIITNNRTSLFGGGIYNNQGSVTINRARIDNNIAGYFGGGVENNSGHLKLNGCMISNNTASESAGGLHIFAYIDESEAIMEDVVISGNRAENGGGIYIGSGYSHVAKLVMNGGSITGNNAATGNGGGVYVDKYDNNISVFSALGSAYVNGNVKGGALENGVYTGGATDNVYLEEGTAITVNGALTAGASMGVTLEKLSTAPPFAAASTGASAYNEGKLSDADITHFTSDVDGYVPGLNSDGKAVLKKIITVSGITAISKTYDGNTVAELDTSKASFTGLIDENDSLTVSATGTFEDANVGKDKVVNITELTLGGDDADKYILATKGQQTTATADIEARPVTVTADDKSKTYGTKDPEFTATVTGVVEGEALNYSLSRPEGESAGTYVIIVTLGDNPNYNITATTGLFVIAQAAATITADNKSKSYGEDDPELTATVTGVVGDDTLKYSLSREDGEDAGDYKISVNYKNADNPNYTIKAVPGTFSITKADIDKPVAVDSLVYNANAQKLVSCKADTNKEVQYVISDSEEAPTEGWSTDIPTATDPGTYKVYYKYAGDTNHNSLTGSITVTIAKPQIGKTEDDDITWYYDEETGTLNITGTGNMVDWRLLSSRQWERIVTIIKKVIISDKITSIGESAFCEGLDIVDVKMPETINTIGSAAFYNCYSLTSIYIPVKVTSIESFAFFDNKSLKKIEYGGTKEQWDAIKKDSYAFDDVSDYVISCTDENIINTSLDKCVIADISDQVYAGEEVKPELSITFNGYPLVAGRDYELAFADNNGAGTAKVTIEGKGTVNGSVEKTFKIVKGTPSYTKPDDKELVCGQTLADIVLGEGFALAEDNEVLKLGENTVKLTYTPADTVNYNVVDDITIKVTVKHLFNKEVVKEEYLKSAADCEHKAVYYKSCLCGEKGSETFEYGDALGHKYGTPTYTWSEDGKSCEAKSVCANDESHVVTETATVTAEVAKEATCKDIGTTTYTATFTKELFTTQTKAVDDVPVLTTHTWDDGVITKEPTCEEKGVKTFTCTVCARTETEDVDALGHDYGEPVYEWSTDGKKCSAKVSCTRKDCVEDIEGHTVSETVDSTASIKVDSTTEKKGVTTYKATFTNKLFEEQTKDIEDIPVKQKESPVEQKSEDTSVVTTKAGTTITVANLNAEVVVTSKLDRTPTVEYVANIDKDAKNVVIPEIINDKGVSYTVTSVAEEAFKNNTAVEKVTIPKTVTDIGDNAFAGCTALKTVSLPESVTEIGANAFNGCKKLTSINVGKNVKKIGDRAFANCTSIKSITIPAKTTTLGNYVFKGDKKLKTIIIKSKNLTAKTIAKNAFKGLKVKKLIVKIKVGSKKENKKYIKKYKKIFTKKNIGVKVVLM